MVCLYVKQIIEFFWKQIKLKSDKTKKKTFKLLQHSDINEKKSKSAETNT